VRPLVIVAGNEVIELGLLSEEVFGGRSGGLQLQSEVHALVTAVLLRVAWLDALELDAESQPPHRQTRQPIEGVGAGEGHAVVGTDGARQTDLLEGALEHVEGVGFLG
jgi:hypothetical protein